MNYFQSRAGAGKVSDCVKNVANFFVEEHQIT